VTKCHSSYHDCPCQRSRLVLPGDHCSITGVYLPIVKTGVRQMSQGLLADTFWKPMYILCVACC
ncbi:hypothetical protein CEXT_648471, partial [Caerostris extrusa]